MPTPAKFQMAPSRRRAPFEEDGGDVATDGLAGFESIVALGEEFIVFGFAVTDVSGDGKSDRLFIE